MTTTRSIIKPLFGHEGQVSEAMEAVSYDMRYQYYFGGSNRPDIDFSREGYDWARRFAVFERKECDDMYKERIEERLIGYIGYGYNPETRRCIWFGAISFDLGNPLFGHAIISVIKDIFEKYNFDAMEFMCYADNPVCETYRRLVERFGGREAGYYRRREMLLDGKLHDEVHFEILAGEYFNAANKRKRGRLSHEIQTRKSISDNQYVRCDLKLGGLCDFRVPITPEICEM